VPGILTGIAAIMSAAAGLIVALDGRPARTAAQADTRPAARTAAAAETEPASPRASGSTTIALSNGGEVALSGGKLVLRIVDARIEPFNADTRVLRLLIRWTNNDAAFVRNYWWTLRLVVDGVPRAPDDPGYEQVEARSARELAYAFAVPSSAGRGVLTISNDSGERAELPIDLQ
jgi:hypothetical protein